jgi:hypothetical protein
MIQTRFSYPTVMGCLFLNVHFNQKGTNVSFPTISFPVTIQAAMAVPFIIFSILPLMFPMMLMQPP